MTPHNGKSQRQFMICPVAGYLCPVPACDWQCEKIPAKDMRALAARDAALTEGEGQSG